MIDVHNGNLTLRVNDEEVRFNIFKSMKFLRDEEPTCKRAEVIDVCVEEVFKEMEIEEPIAKVLLTFLTKDMVLEASQEVKE